MIEIDKVQRDHIAHILHQLNIDAVDNPILTHIMKVLGFEDDVVFAKSLLADKIISIYVQNQGEYEKFLALDKVSQLPYAAKCLLFSIFRRYSQAKIKQQSQEQTQPTQQTDISQLTIPNSNNIDQIIHFQKKMYQNLKHLIPKQGNNQFYNFASRITPKHSQMSAFRSNSYSPDNTLRNIDHQYLSSIRNPLLPQFNNRSFITYPNYDQHNKSSDFFSFRSEPFAHNDEMLSKLSYLDTKKQMQSLDQFDSKHRSSISGQRSHVKEEETSPRGFTAYSFSQIGGVPCKKVKKDLFVQAYNPQNIRRANEEIQVYKRNQWQMDRVKAEKDSAVGELNINHSISEYLVDDKPEQQVRRQSK